MNMKNFSLLSFVLFVSVQPTSIRAKAISQEMRTSIQDAMQATIEATMQARQDAIQAALQAKKRQTPAQKKSTDTQTDESMPQQPTLQNPQSPEEVAAYVEAMKEWVTQYVVLASE